MIENYKYYVLLISFFISLEAVEKRRPFAEKDSSPIAEAMEGNLKREMSFMEKMDKEGLQKKSQPKKRILEDETRGVKGTIFECAVIYQENMDSFKEPIELSEKSVDVNLWEEHGDEVPFTAEFPIKPGSKKFSNHIPRHQGDLEPL